MNKKEIANEFERKLEEALAKHDRERTEAERLAEAGYEEAQKELEQLKQGGSGL